MSLSFKIRSKYTLTLVVVLLFAASYYTAGFVGAPAAPPSCPVGTPGCNAPLTTSNIGQIKVGGLTLNTGGAPIGLIVDKGQVGVGLSTPNAKLAIADNSTSPALSITQSGSGNILELKGRNSSAVGASQVVDTDFNNGVQAYTQVSGAGSAADLVLATDLATFVSNIKWSQAGSPAFTDIEIDNAKTYAYVLHGLDLEKRQLADGLLLWSQTVANRQALALTIDNGFAYLVGKSHLALPFIEKRNLSNGQLEWHVDISGTTGSEFAGKDLVVDNSNIYLLDRDLASFGFGTGPAYHIFKYKSSDGSFVSKAQLSDYSQADWIDATLINDGNELYAFFAQETGGASAGGRLAKIRKSNLAML